MSDKPLTPDEMRDSPVSKKEHKERIADNAIRVHEAWMAVMNFSHPHLFSSRAQEALEARTALRKIEEAYDAAFSRLTSSCELYRQWKMK